MVMLQPIRAHSILLLACLAACHGGTRGGETPRAGEPPPLFAMPAPSPAPMSPASPATAAAASQLSAADREAFYHLAEGSELAPLDMVKALRSRVTGKPFLENPERFGLIADPGNPDGLPVGATGDTTVDTRFLGIRMLGFNCSACHVNQVTFRGTAVRLDGAPSRFFPDSLQGELVADGKYTISHPRALWQYFKDLRAIERARPAAVAAREPALLSAAGAVGTDAVLARLSDADTTPAEREFVAQVQRALAEDSAANPAVNLLNVPWDSTASTHRALRRRYGRPSAHVLADRVLSRLRPRTRAELRIAPVPAAAANTAHRESISDFIIAIRLLRDRIATLGGILHQQHGVATTKDGVGRVDAFGVARNKLWPHDRVPTTAPVSFPFLWGFEHTSWLHYDANTNSVMERNLGQALGVGAVWDRRTLQSTLNPRNIHRLEQIARTIPSPAWPAAFPAIDAAKAAQGRALFGQYCAGCHRDRSSADVCYPLATMGTDSLRPINFALPLGRGHFTDSVAPVLNGLKRQAYRTFHVSPDSQRIMDGIPDAQVVWRTTRMWGVRPLDGVWATAPYRTTARSPRCTSCCCPPASAAGASRWGRRSTTPFAWATAPPPRGCGRSTPRSPGTGTAATNTARG